MDTTRIAALLQPFLQQALSLKQLNQISTYINLLQYWNERINLTAIRDEEEIVTRHFGESLFLAHQLFPDPAAPKFLFDNLPGAQSGAASAEGSSDQSRALRAAALQSWGGVGFEPVTGSSIRVLDIGSGAGFPALPLKIWAPSIDLTLVESQNKKAIFLREVARALTLTNVNVMAARAESLSVILNASFDLVTLRAVERFETVLPQAEAFLAPGGTLALLIGSSQVARAAILTSLHWLPSKELPGSNTRVLLVGTK